MDLVFIIHAFRNGKEDAFATLFRQYYKRLCFFCHGITQHTGAAEDIVSDVMMKLWEKREEFQSIESLKGFLYTSCKNASLNFLRAKKNADLRNQAFVIRSGGSADSIEELIISAETMQRIYEQMESLPSACRQVMKVLFIDGKSPKEMSEETGLSVKTISRQKGIGIEKLKGLMRERD